MNLPTGIELMEVGNVFIQWGLMLITFGLATMAIGFSLLLIGKIFFTDQTDLVLAFFIEHLR